MRQLESISPHSASADGYNDRRILSPGIQFQPTEADLVKLNCSTSLAGWVVGPARRFPEYRPCECRAIRTGFPANWRATVDEDGHYSFAVAL